MPAEWRQWPAGLNCPPSIRPEPINLVTHPTNGTLDNQVASRGLRDYVFPVQFVEYLDLHGIDGPVEGVGQVKELTRDSPAVHHVTDIAVFLVVVHFLALQFVNHCRGRTDALEALKGLVVHRQQGVGPVEVHNAEPGGYADIQVFAVGFVLNPDPVTGRSGQECRCRSSIVRGFKLRWLSVTRGKIFLAAEAQSAIA